MGKKQNKWDKVYKYVIVQKNKGLTYNEIAPTLKEYFDIDISPIGLRQKLSDNGMTSKIRKIQVVNKLSNNAGLIPNIQPLNWEIKKSNVKSKPGKGFKSYLVIADTHVPYINQIATKSVLSLMDDIPFDGFILLGDYMDMAPISHWLQKKNKRLALENQRMKADYIEGNKLLDEFDKRLPNDCDKRFFYGNHERFYYDLVEELPALEGYFEPKTELKLKERGYKVYDTINHIERIGRLSFTHGMSKSTKYFLKWHIDEFKTNVLHAHNHSPRMRLTNSPAKEIAIAGYAVGCLCDLNPDYWKNKPSQWAHGFAIVYMFDNGFFHVDLKRIIKGKFIYNNKLYDGYK